MLATFPEEARRLEEAGRKMDKLGYLPDAIKKYEESIATISAALEMRPQDTPQDEETQQEDPEQRRDKAEQPSAPPSNAQLEETRKEMQEHITQLRQRVAYLRSLPENTVPEIPVEAHLDALRGEFVKGAAFVVVGGVAGSFVWGGLFLPIGIAALLAARYKSARKVGNTAIDGCKYVKAKAATKLPEASDVQAISLQIYANLPETAAMQAVVEAKTPSREQVINVTMKVKTSITESLVAATKRLLGIKDPEKLEDVLAKLDARSQELNEKIETLNNQFVEHMENGRKEQARQTLRKRKSHEESLEQCWKFSMNLQRVREDSEQAELQQLVKRAMEAGHEQLKVVVPSVAAVDTLMDDIAETQGTAADIQERLAEDLDPEPTESMLEVELAAIIQKKENESKTAAPSTASDDAAQAASVPADAQVSTSSCSSMAEEAQAEPRSPMAAAA